MTVTTSIDITFFTILEAESMLVY